jgi:hypothetical protein
VNVNHIIIAKIFEEVNNSLRKVEPTCKKRSNPSSDAMSIFFITKNPFQKDHMQQILFLEDLGLSIVKNHLPM